ncbi:MAG TPA: serine/threonine-protein kinase [Thermoanaerobaculia bacterium]|nr:serine/threonine-protein kinase [Thermoanaerobaculia bacterium]
MSATETEGLPKSVGHYDVESVLGNGAMGTVYLCRDRRIGRRVALKTVHIDRRQFDDSNSAIEYFSRLQREAELSGSLHHPNIVTLFEAGYENDRISYLAMEYIDGESLQHLMRRLEHLPIGQTLNIAEDVLRGLSYAHSRGIIHRDIKPANILVGSDGRARVADFGIARPQTSNLTASGALMGTPNYMSPEQVKGVNVSTRSDLFSVGAMLYEMLTGKKPFPGEDLPGILYKVVHEQPLSAKHMRPDITDELETFVNRLMAKKPEDRFASAGDALGELRRVRGEPGSETEALPTFADTPREVTPIDLNAETAPTISYVRPLTFWSVIGVLMMAFLIPAGLLLWSANRPAVELIPPEKIAEFEEKKGMLTHARMLQEQGEFQESAATYKSLLRRYPDNQAAKVGLAEMLRADKHSDGSITVSSPGHGASKPKRDHRPSWHDRIRKFFHIGG